MEKWFITEEWDGRDQLPHGWRYQIDQCSRLVETATATRFY